jgi:hypothetical protein
LCSGIINNLGEMDENYEQVQLASGVGQGNVKR